MTEAEITEVVETLRGGWLTTGQRTRDFEKAFGAYLGHTHSVAVNSCTAALHLALEAIGVGPGDGVLVPTMTFAATAEVVRYLGAIPILIDGDADDFNLDVADAARRLAQAQQDGIPVKAMMPVHYGGQIGDVDAYTALARAHGLKIIEDAAHCCPAYYRKKLEAGSRELESAGRDQVASMGAANSPLVSRPSSLDPSWLPVGRSADISCFSFYANKCITTGEGGMACTENAEYADRMRIMSLHGISRDAWKRFTGEGTWYYEIVAPGYKYNLTDIASALGLVQLQRADELLARRAAIADRYDELLKDVEELDRPPRRPDRVHAWHLYPIRLRLETLIIDRAAFIEKLKEAGIVTSVHYQPLHLHPYYREKFGYRPEDLPKMTAAYPRIITLPLYPDMTVEEVEYVSRTVRELVGRHRCSSARG